MSIYKKIKEEVDFLSAMERYIGPLKQCGGDTYTTDADECPIHGGHGCFRIKVDGENSLINCFGNCTHDEWPLDLIGFVKLHKGLESQSEAARLIASDFGIEMPTETVNVKIYRMAKDYYLNLLQMGVKKLKCLGKKTPLEYQLNVRNHKRSTIDQLEIGWSDGGLIEYLEDEFTPDQLLGSGLIKELRGKLVDVIPSESFVYPHYWNGMVSRFTFKHTGSLAHQIRKQFWLNGIEFYSVGDGTPVAVVEGENDLATLVDEGWPGTVLCTNGSFSKAQLEWMCEHPTDYHTFWDGDDAGGKYADKVWVKHITGQLPKVTQWALPEGSDIDSYLQEYELDDLKEMVPPDRDEIVDIQETNRSSIVEENGIYKAISMSKDGETEKRIPISDFVVQLLYVKVQGEDRSRVIRIIRNDGRKSRPVVVDSEAKVSLRHWRILVANAVDASFTGSDFDLSNMWSYIYSKQREAVVDVPTYIGDMEGGKGWIFGNQYIGEEGDIEGDDDNIMWFDKKKTHGIAPKSLMASLSSTAQTADIPHLWRGEDSEEFIKDICMNLHDILKDPGLVLLILGWMRSCAYSMPLFYKAKIKFFPFLLLWGRHGRGKSTLANWMLSFYDMADKGTTTVGQLRSGVGIERKLAYYRGLPYCIDELRADRQASEYSRTWRGWYNRSSRVKGTHLSENVIQVPLNSCLFFSGQDTFTDPAMRSRCIPCKFPSNAGDDRAYIWLEDNLEEFPTVGYHWIREAMDSDILQIRDGISEYKEALKVITPGGISSRSLGNYAMVGYFAKDLAEKCFPEFDLMRWIVDTMVEEQKESVESDMVSQFWDGIAGLQIGDRPAINGNHLTVKNDRLYVWYTEVHKLVAANSRGSDAQEAFSRGAVRDALLEEPYYEAVGSTRLGATGTTRRCLVFKTIGDSLPQEFLSVVETTRNVL